MCKSGSKAPGTKGDFFLSNFWSIFGGHREPAHFRAVGLSNLWAVYQGLGRAAAVGVVRSIAKEMSVGPAYTAS